MAAETAFVEVMQSPEGGTPEEEATESVAFAQACAYNDGLWAGVPQEEVGPNTSHVAKGAHLISYREYCPPEGEAGLCRGGADRPGCGI